MRETPLKSINQEMGCKHSAQLPPARRSQTQENQLIDVCRSIHALRRAVDNIARDFALISVQGMHIIPYRAVNECTLFINGNNHHTNIWTDDEQNRVFQFGDHLFRVVFDQNVGIHYVEQFNIHTHQWEPIRNLNGDRAFIRLDNQNNLRIADQVCAQRRLNDLASLANRADVLQNYFLNTQNCLNQFRAGVPQAGESAQTENMAAAAQTELSRLICLLTRIRLTLEDSRIDILRSYAIINIEPDAVSQPMS